MFKTLNYEQWLEIFEEEIKIELAESGADRELDFNLVNELEKRFSTYQFLSAQENIHRMKFNQRVSYEPGLKAKVLSKSIQMRKEFIQSVANEAERCMGIYQFEVPSPHHFEKLAREEMIKEELYGKK